MRPEHQSQHLHEEAGSDAGLSLAQPQWLLLRGLVARAAQEEADRVARMKARPAGSHTDEKIAEAEALALEMSALEEAVERAAEHQEAQGCTDRTRVYQGHVAAPGYGVAYECSVCGRPWLKLGAGWVDPSTGPYELSPEDVV